MVAAATSRELKSALQEHLDVTKTHVKRLEQAFESLDEKAEGKVCPAIKGLVKEGEELISETEGDSMTRDAPLIIGAQKIEHYEIASYGRLLTLAKRMRHDKAAKLLDNQIGEKQEANKH